MDYLTLFIFGVLIGVIVGQLSVWRWLRKRGYSHEDFEE